MLTQAEISNELRKVLQNAIKLQKKRSDTYLSVDTLLLAVLENKDVADALNESGVLSQGQQRSALHLTLCVLTIKEATFDAM